ncbi:MAG: RhuM family protein [Paludibacteraceae bacterium]|nr:RhuM family protein [Paludibacteraceae bacterium]
MDNNSITKTSSSEETHIVLYHPDDTLSLEVKLDQDTVWLTQAQMVDLFGSSKGNVSEHITNIYSQGELSREATVRNFRTVRKEGNRMVYRNIDYYNLDMIISVGFRVNSRQGILFRQWANKVLKEYLLQGYSINQHLVSLQQQIDSRMSVIEHRQDQQQQQLDFFIKTSTAPAEMVFFNGQFFSARVAIENLIKTAKHRVVVIDHYVDAKTFDMFDVRQPGVIGIVYTHGVGDGMKRLRDEHNRQIGVQPVEVFKWKTEPHDRFLIIDDKLYHCGHSLNATGGKLSAIMLMGTPPEIILAEMV